MNEASMVRVALPVATCHIWWAAGGTMPADRAYLLDPQERARMRRLHHDSDRRRFLAAHVLVRLVLAGYLGCVPEAVRFVHRCGGCGGPHGKPGVAGGAVEFSLSHAGDRVAVAVAREPVGLDVEAHARDLDVSAFAAVALAPPERAVLDALAVGDRPVGLLRYWTRKEAVLKATGRGLSTDPADVAVSAPAAPPRLLGWTAQGPPPTAVQLHELDLGRGFEACVAVLSNLPHRIEVRDAGEVLPGSAGS